MAFDGVVVDVAKTVDVWWDHVADSVRAAMVDAWHRHGPPTIDPVRGGATLAEEAGEVIAEALEATRLTATPGSKIDSLRSMHRELAQAAGYTILLMVSMEGEIRKMEREARVAT